MRLKNGDLAASPGAATENVRIWAANQLRLLVHFFIKELLKFCTVGIEVFAKCIVSLDGHVSSVIR